MRTKASAETPFASVFAPETGPVLLAEQTLRQRCCYCAVKHMTDGLGPILDGQLVSDGMCGAALQRFNADIDAMERAK